MVLDLKGKIRLHNPAMRNLFGAIVDLNTFDGFWRHCMRSIDAARRSHTNEIKEAQNAALKQKAAELLKLDGCLA